MTQNFNLEQKIALRVGHRIQWEEAQQAHVLLFPEGMIKLNESAAEILKRCDGSKTGAQIIEELSADYPDVDLTQDVLLFLADAQEKSWIDVVRAT
ncbi:MAG TPA: pyrroloquinoline quinone biosynthesis peptide chaperone PqqD [Gammaproteobacteria bacterium]|nr:pyrroloquinoline quinone biosynthesis peptide chaperone PqqD [Gammaproteobacteria bacterium]